ncbi:YybH family protein [Granulosicoccus antarcticus]|uniref:DUF4440 domain-containing protein n=1 Tax=Granulosicoccus antarcticus IMCC3135 TaxID=1192854 RepID=A0A2Z2NJ82_9GAMM|nr:DUF4440 domain-containing protein [Granulosicoccus antarcticus]ASJ71229.1 hypothetical protein IMCC3135_05585 [Granulosicoccus antarcticus IMCC3135]
MSDIEALKSALAAWIDALDGGDIDRLVATCDPGVIVCNENQPTSIGVELLREKYASRMDSFAFKSAVEIEEIRLFGDFAIMITHFDVQMTNKDTGQLGGGRGRLIIGYRKNEHGEWKMALDVDNND